MGEGEDPSYGQRIPEKPGSVRRSHLSWGKEMIAKNSMEGPGITNGTNRNV